MTEVKLQTPSEVRRPAMISLDEALSALLAKAVPLTSVETVPTFDADGRVLAADLVSPLHVPAHDNSAMDGYAVRCADVTQAGALLQVSQRIAAGSNGKPLRAMNAARIFTGAPLPALADAVVMQEDCEVVNGLIGQRGSQVALGDVRINAVPQPGQWIRRAGEDVALGSVVLLKGERLTPASLGLASSIGLNTLPVAVRPRVALFSTGDELVMPGDVAPDQMKPGSIYNSNRFFLRALLQRLGCVVTDFGIVPDRREATVAALQQAASQHDLILTSGGVSVGEEDHIKPAVLQLGSIEAWQIAIKPGKPFVYGEVRREGGDLDGNDPDGAPAPVSGSCHIIGLPGNPVSSFITFLLLVRPFILRLQGVTDVASKSIAIPAHFTWAKPDKRREFLRVRRNATGGLDLFPNQSSGVLTSVIWGDGMVDNPPEKTIAHGELVQFIPFAQLVA